MFVITRKKKAGLAGNMLFLSFLFAKIVAKGSF